MYVKSKQGFLDQLKDLLSDSNPMVVANAVAALSEINEASVSGHPLVGKKFNTFLCDLVGKQAYDSSDNKPLL